MKTETIKVSELDKYLRIVRMERDLQIVLTNYLDEQKRQLDRLQKIKKLAETLSNYRTGSYAKWWKQLSPELRKQIEKHSRGRFV